VNGPLLVELTALGCGKVAADRSKSWLRAPQPAFPRLGHSPSRLPLDFYPRWGATVVLMPDPIILDVRLMELNSSRQIWKGSYACSTERC
jgi:hypothetical protein